MMTMTTASAYYNDIDPFAAQWLRNLAGAGHIVGGTVDDRDIRVVRSDDLRGHAQCHFFAGIGAWSYALRLVGWPDDRPVWTGSCPCQPFSAAGKRNGFSDDRHLWPAWFRLIRQCRPPVIFGEQVASKDGYAWLDHVQADLEGAGYAFGAVVLPAAGFGAPHARHRIYFVADAGIERLQRLQRDAERLVERTSRKGRMACGMANANRELLDKQQVLLFQEEGRNESDLPETAGCGVTCERSPVNGFWSGAEWVYCRDGKWRPVEPGSFPLADGVPARVGRLRAYGNAIVPQVAAGFIASYLNIAQG